MTLTGLSIVAPPAGGNPARRGRWVALGMLLMGGIAGADVPPVVTAAIPRDAPPNYLIDDSGRPTGFAVELMALIARRAGVEVRYRVEDNWAATLETLRSGRAELIPNLGITPERLREFAFSDPVETFRISLFVRQDSYGITGLADLRGRKVAVIRANAAEELLKKHREIRTELFPDFPDALFALLSGNVDALAYPEPWTWHRARAARVGDEIKVVGEPLAELKRALAVRAADSKLLARLAPAVSAALASNEYRALYAKWNGTPEPFWTVRRLAWAMTLVLAVAIVGMGMWRYRTIARVNRALTAALAERERAETRFATALEAAGMGGWDWDAKTNTITWSENVEAIFGLTPGSFRRTYEAFLELVIDEDRDNVSTSVRDALAQRGEYRIEYRIRQSGGTVRWLASYGRGFYDRSGHPERMAGTVCDITARKHAELERERLLDDLERRTTEMEGFVYTISHDLRAPLITVSGFAQLLERDVERGDIEHARESLNEIRKAAQGMERLIEDLLTLARTGRIVGEAQEVDFSDLIADLRAGCSHRIQREGATLRLAGTLPRLRVDPARFGQVLQNLVDNAIKYRRPEESPTIEIGAEQHADEMRLYVRDNGRGIPSAYYERIFGLFQRLDSDSEGTGVGLTIARRIVEVHGGRLWVESEPGRGSTFWIALPASAVVA